MQEVFLDDVDQAFENFRERLVKYKDYLDYLEKKARTKKGLTPGEKEILRKHGKISRGDKKSGNNGSS